ncbi:hypothetical protein CIL05_19990 [Virgibacillus profundi]|uniref:SpoVT-AbrB domain-containing protein n=1 Tax=Virgibacillus profundi TaxID=2024555 RepID=A0A2A2I8D0_9BACI|nr:AbrB/MazE/SpoVT family DNA-binding domain-containing protein [Virgibacillus profundi]PAV27832.1 hypothetical protein CIL05_19990 [Virgibacillus profundi]PXY51959.1 hypothetical protein CIT14_20355 [Virgibacillus profundi]
MLKKKKNNCEIVVFFSGKDGIRIGEVNKMYCLENYKTIGKHGMINLPKKWRLKLGFNYGELVEIRLHNREIWICHTQEENTENQRYISTKGTVNIPSEIRKLLEIGADTRFRFYVTPEENAFVLVPIHQTSEAPVR